MSAMFSQSLGCNRSQHPLSTRQQGTELLCPGHSPSVEQESEQPHSLLLFLLPLVALTYVGGTWEHSTRTASASPGHVQLCEALTGQGLFVRSVSPEPEDNGGADMS